MTRKISGGFGKRVALARRVARRSAYRNLLWRRHQCSSGIGQRSVTRWRNKKAAAAKGESSVCGIKAVISVTSA